MSSKGINSSSSLSTDSFALLVESTPLAADPSPSQQQLIGGKEVQNRVQSEPASGGGRCAQMWNLQRPVLGHCPLQKRRDLRVLDRSWTIQEVRDHRYKDDAWIAVAGKVYDITEHIVDHPGWDSGCGISTILSILAHAGTECTAEFNEIHRPYPVAFKQLRAYYIGDLAPSTPAVAADGRREVEEVGTMP